MTIGTFHGHYTITATAPIGTYATGLSRAKT